MYKSSSKLYIVLFLHQTTTQSPTHQMATELYIVLFLHQTTTSGYETRREVRCISYYSYIKPQHYYYMYYLITVVYRTIPTSNHNQRDSDSDSVVYRTIPTSNHNQRDSDSDSVVYRTIPTSNHN